MKMSDTCLSILLNILIPYVTNKAVRSEGLLFWNPGPDGACYLSLGDKLLWSMRPGVNRWADRGRVRWYPPHRCPDSDETITRLHSKSGRIYFISRVGQRKAASLFSLTWPVVGAILRRKSVHNIRSMFLWLFRLFRWRRSSKITWRPGSVSRPAASLEVCITFAEGRILQTVNLLEEMP